MYKSRETASQELSVKKDVLLTFLQVLKKP